MTPKTRKKIHMILLISTIIFILVFTLIINETFEFRTNISRGISLIPFKELVGIFREWNPSFYFWQIVLNILLFIPFGFSFTTYLNCHTRVPHLMRLVLLTGFLLSTSVETLQYITGRGLTEVDDIINNTLGGLVGYWCYEMALKISKAK